MQYGRSYLVNRSPVLRYGFATLIVAGATVLRSALVIFVPNPTSTPLYLSAIIVTTWIGGLRLGIYASILATLAVDYFFVQPYFVVKLSQLEITRTVLYGMGAIMVSWLVDRLRLATEEMIASRAELRELTRYQEFLRNDEQNRIAREIHDELGESLTGLKLGIHLAQKQVQSARSPEAAAGVVDSLERLSDQVDLTIDAVSRISAELRPAILHDFGLAEAIEWYALEFEKKTGIQCRFRSNVTTILIDRDITLAIYRIFTEAMVNIARHASATRVAVVFDVLPGSLLLRVEDDGQGISPEKFVESSSLGLIGMRERAHFIGARLVFTRADPCGTIVRLLVPLKSGEIEASS